VVRDQWRAFVTALATVPGPTWVSPPARIHAAESKALQLRRAHDAGLSGPDSVWTNDVKDCRPNPGRSTHRTRHSLLHRTLFPGGTRPVESDRPLSVAVCPEVGGPGPIR
jgi:hypothetical protein